MADDATTDAVAQARAAGDQLLSELQAAVSGRTPAPQAPTASHIKDSGARTRQRVTQIAEDMYWAPRRQMEQAIAARTAKTSAHSAEERIAQIKQQLGT